VNINLKGGNGMKKTMLLPIVLVVLIAMVSMLNLFGCKQEVAEEPAAEEVAEEPAAEEVAEEPAAEEVAIPYIAIISKGFQHQFWQTVREGAEKAAEDYNVEITFEGPESEDAVAEQVDQLRAAIDKNPDAICIAAVDSKAVIPQLEEADEAGIPVIGFDSGVESDIPVTTCATDNYAASALAGEKMLELINTDTGKIAVLDHSQTASSGIERRDGFVDKINEEAPNIEVIVEYSNGDSLKGTDLTKTLITANPELKGFFGTAGNDTNGILNGIKELNMVGEFVVVGFDAGKQQLDAIRSGEEAGAITQDPYGIGYKAVEYALKAINGESVPNVVDTGFYWYDKNNIDSDKIAPLLYE
jgi:ribose transport system substrate-binding protein